MPSHDQSDHHLPFAIPDGDDAEMAALIDSWRYAGPQVTWDDVVGHAPQKARCLQLVEKLRRSPEELARLRIRVGAGLVISGPSGVGKTLLARALATALGRDVIVVPTAELSAETVRRLYAQLAKDPRRVLVLLDEAETIIGHPWQRSSDEAVLAALLAALDGVDRPAQGPITVALTTLGLDDLDPAAVRPGRLAPRLALEAPQAEDRILLLERLIKGLPTRGSLDLEAVVDRTGGWTGAELAGAVEEACARSLLDASDALRQDLLLQVVAERYVVRDEEEEEADPLTYERIAVHEAGHALYAWLTMPGALAAVKLHRRHGQTELHDAVKRIPADPRLLRRHAELALAGIAAELVCYGPEWLTEGGNRDREEATGLLLRLLALRHPYAVDPLEAGGMSDRGSERLRAAWQVELESLADETLAAAVRWMGPHEQALRNFGRLLLEAPEGSLSGEALEAAIEQAVPGSASGLFGGEADPD